MDFSNFISFSCNISNTRRNGLKINVEQFNDICRHYCFGRVAETWNGLPYSVLTEINIRDLKNHSDSDEVSKIVD